MRGRLIPAQRNRGTGRREGGHTGGTLWVKVEDLDRAGGGRDRPGNGAKAGGNTGEQAEKEGGE